MNLTDGIDGLAASVTAVVAAFFTALFLQLGGGQDATAAFSAGLLGSLLGFLLYNFHPARAFMGDTGSLFLGGAVCGLAFALDIPLVLILVGFVYIVETLSDIIQVVYFKLTHGKRIFKMAPIHHHFEMCGWSEEKIVFVFSAITAVMCVISGFRRAALFGLSAPAMQSGGASPSKPQLPMYHCIPTGRAKKRPRPPAWISHF